MKRLLRIAVLFLLIVCIQNVTAVDLQLRAASISLPCRFNDLLQPGTFVETGGMRFSNFAIAEQIGPLLESNLAVLDGTTNEAAGLLFRPDTAAFAVSGISSMRVFEFVYDAVSLNENMPILESRIAIEGNTQGDAFLGNQLTLEGAEPPFLATPLGIIESWLDGLFGNELSGNLSFPDGIARVHARARFDAQSYEESANTSLNSVVNKYVLAPEPSALALVGAGCLLFGVGCRSSRLHRNCTYCSCCSDLPSHR